MFESCFTFTETYFRNQRDVTTTIQLLNSMKLVNKLLSCPWSLWMGRPRKSRITKFPGRSSWSLNSTKRNMKNAQDILNLKMVRNSGIEYSYKSIDYFIKYLFNINHIFRLRASSTIFLVLLDSFILF